MTAQQYNGTFHDEAVHDANSETQCHWRRAEMQISNKR